MRMPYQYLERCGNVLVAASGSRIDSFNIEDGSLLSTWKCPVIEDSKSAKENKKQEVTDTPPAKRRKLSSAAEDQDQEKEKNEKKKATNRSDAVSSGLESPAVIALTCTKSGGHVIAVTGEDKSIRVFEHDGVGHLKQLSQRAMPKRPCAITITEDDSTIISADKFGDVYSIPLIPSQPAITELTLQDAKAKSQTPDPVAAKPFVPAANDLTVHSVRNRKALENQKKQTNKAPERTEPTFEHKLLLGHVSMLTDITLVTLENRNYIITADRDEHIRISRGIPQSHIIEGFCLGHTEFISRLCVPKDRPELLISGGGEDELYVWNWSSGELLFTADIKSHLATVLDPTNGENAAEPKKLTVSGSYHTRLSNAESVNDFVTITCEGVPALFIYELTAQRLRHSQTVILPGNVLAVSPISTATESNLIISIDTIHKAGSTTERRDDITSPLITYTFSNKILTEKSLDYFSLDPVADDDDISEGNNAIGRLTNLLYNLENLRKRDGGDKDEE